jgi:hypothetical protein
VRIMFLTCSAGSSLVPIAKFVTGLLCCCLSHSSMAERSYTLPSSAVTGSTGSEKVMGQTSSAKASSVALLCRRSCTVSSWASAAGGRSAALGGGWTGAGVTGGAGGAGGLGGAIGGLGGAGGARAGGVGGGIGAGGAGGVGGAIGAGGGVPPP